MIPAPGNSYYYSRHATSPGWSGRDGASLIYDPDSGEYLQLGGWHDPDPLWDNLRITNEIWGSTDLVTWNKLLAHDSDPPQTGPGARWKPRHSFGCLLSGGSIYVVGADIYTGGGVGDAEVWRSDDHARSWTRLTDSAPWGPRVLHMVGLHDAKLHVLGGQTDYTDPATALNDHWSSSDGINWTQESASCGWGARGQISTPTSWNGSLWLVAGSSYANAPEDRTYFNDVWSWDGDSWTQHANCPCIAAGYVNLLAYQSGLWLFNGYGLDGLDGTYKNISQAYYTLDGENWTYWGDVLEPSHADAMCVNGLRMVRAAGNYSVNAASTVWSLDYCWDPAEL